MGIFVGTSHSINGSWNAEVLYFHLICIIFAKSRNKRPIEMPKTFHQPCLSHLLFHLPPLPKSHIFCYQPTTLV